MGKQAEQVNTDVEDQIRPGRMIYECHFDKWVASGWLRQLKKENNVQFLQDNLFFCSTEYIYLSKFQVIQIKQQNKQVG